MGMQVKSYEVQVWLAPLNVCVKNNFLSHWDVIPPNNYNKKFFKTKKAHKASRVGNANKQVQGEYMVVQVHSVKSMVTSEFCCMLQAYSGFVAKCKWLVCLHLSLNTSQNEQILPIHKNSNTKYWFFSTVFQVYAIEIQLTDKYSRTSPFPLFRWTPI